MGDYANWEIEDSIWGHPVWGRQKKSYPHVPSNPPKVRFRGKTGSQYLEFIGVHASDWDRILMEFEDKYPSNGVKLTAKFKKDKNHDKQRYWSKFINYCQQFKST